MWAATSSSQSARCTPRGASPARLLHLGQRSPSRDSGSRDLGSSWHGRAQASSNPQGHGIQWQGHQPRAGAWATDPNRLKRISWVAWPSDPGLSEPQFCILRSSHSHLLDKADIVNTTMNTLPPARPCTHSRRSRQTAADATQVTDSGPEKRVTGGQSRVCSHTRLELYQVGGRHKGHPYP